MSLILEALRKSEAERRRGQAPDVAMELPPTPASRPPVLGTWLLPALIIAGLLVLAGWWMKREPSTSTLPEAVIEAADTTPTQDAPLPALAPRIEPTPTAPALAVTPAPEMKAPVLSTPLSEAAKAARAAQKPTPAPAQGVTPLPPPPIETMATGAIPPRPQPQPASAISNDTSMLPPIKLSMHMWDDVPSKRFVILNGQRMAEGDRHGEITVLAIERAGVVVESNGAKARVPLP